MIGDKGLLDGANAMTTRRMFLTAGAGAAVGMALPGCVGLGRHENAAVRMAMRKAVADGLYGGLVVGSNRGELYVEGRRTFFDPALPMTEASSELPRRAYSSSLLTVSSGTVPRSR